MTVLHVVLPNDIDDPAHPSGGNHYDRQICDGLTALGWVVHEHAVRGSWPRPAAVQRANLAAVLTDLPEGAVVLIDGLVASAVPELLAPQGGRLRLVVLVHAPLGHAAEDAALGAAQAIVVTSEWTRCQLRARGAVPADRIHVARPGATVAPLATGSAAGTGLLCVAAVTPLKGHDRLVSALAAVADLEWRCVCVGSLARDPGFVGRVRQRVVDCGLAGRVNFVGARTGADLAAEYAAADLLVLASRAETYGMVVTEAVARGVPVVATAVGGVAEALGQATDGSRPGMLVAPAGLAHALRRWLTDAELRARLRQSARNRRGTLPGWADTAVAIAAVLDGVRTA
jgi:hypothetical protein